MALTHDLLRRLNDHHVEYVVVGGLASVVHGSSVVTQDVDVCADLIGDNLARIVSALRDLQPRHRMNPSHPPLPEDPQRLEGYRNLYLVTDLGQLDILSEISGVGAFPEVWRTSLALDIGGLTCRVMGLDALIVAKRALGRPKDIQVAIELEAIRERLRSRG